MNTSLDKDASSCIHSSLNWILTYIDLGSGVIPILQKMLKIQRIKIGYPCPQLLSGLPTLQTSPWLVPQRFSTPALDLREPG